jgi:hypothetical protein
MVRGYCPDEPAARDEVRSNCFLAFEEELPLFLQVALEAGVALKVAAEEQEDGEEAEAGENDEEADRVRGLAGCGA